MAGNPHLLGDEVIHGHLLAEGTGWVDLGATGDCAFAVIGEKYDRAVGEVEGGEWGLGIGHVGELGEIIWGFGQQEVLIGGEGLGLDGNPELGFDLGFELADCGLWVFDLESFQPISASNS